MMSHNAVRQTLTTLSSSLAMEPLKEQTIGLLRTGEESSICGPFLRHTSSVLFSGRERSGMRSDLLHEKSNVSVPDHHLPYNLHLPSLMR